MRDYSTFLAGKQSYLPVHGQPLRTERRPGDVEIVRDYKTGQWVKITYQLEESN